MPGLLIGTRTGAHLRLSLRTPLRLLQALLFGVVHVGLGYSVRCTGAGCEVCNGDRSALGGTRHLLWVHVTEQGGVEIERDFVPCDSHWSLYRVRLTTEQNNRLAELMRGLDGRRYNSWAWLNSVPGAELVGLSQGLGDDTEEEPLTVRRLRKQKTYFCSELVAGVLKTFVQKLADDPLLPAPRNCWPHHVEAALARLADEYRKKRRPDPLVEKIRAPDGPLTADSIDDADRRIRALLYDDGSGAFGV